MSAEKRHPHPPRFLSDWDSRVVFSPPLPQGLVMLRGEGQLCKEPGWHKDCSEDKAEGRHMVGSSTRKRKQQQCLSWGVVLFLASDFLSLCTLNPHVHAAILRQAAANQPLAAGHCARPSVVPQPVGPLTADHERPTEPLCCEMRGAHNKALRASSVQTDAAPFLLLTLLPPDIGTLTGEVQSLHIIQALRLSRPPPLYLVYTALLI